MSNAIDTDVLGNSSTIEGTNLLHRAYSFLQQVLEVAGQGDNELKIAIKHYHGENTFDPPFEGVLDSEQLRTKLFLLQSINQLRDDNPKLFNFLECAIDEFYMNAPDPGHGIGHILNILQNYEEMRSKLIVLYPDFNEQRFLAITVLHDVYTSQVPKDSISRIVGAWLRDGDGSADMIRTRIWTQRFEQILRGDFTNQIEGTTGMNSLEFRTVMSEVKRHSALLSRFKCKTPEGKLMMWLDNLDQTNPYRIMIIMIQLAKGISQKYDNNEDMSKVLSTDCITCLRGRIYQYFSNMGLKYMNSIIDDINSKKMILSQETPKDPYSSTFPVSFFRSNYEIREKLLRRLDFADRFANQIYGIIYSNNSLDIEG